MTTLINWRCILHLICLCLWIIDIKGALITAVIKMRGLLIDIDMYT